MQISTWLKVSGVTLYVGGDPEHGKPPVLTVNHLDKPQILIDPDKNTITIVENK